MRLLITILTLAILTSQQTHAQETKVYCSFETLPPMTLVLRGGMGANDNSLQVGNNEAVSLSIGSSLSLAKFDGNEYIISWQHPASVTIAKLDGSNAKFTRFGDCSSNDEIFSSNPVTDTKTAVLQGFVWNDVSICRAALKTYFFLKELPEFRNTQERLHIFESNSGNSYACSINGSVAEFIWLNQQGKTMTSKSTLFSFSNSNLEVISDMQTEIFEMPN